MHGWRRHFFYTRESIKTTWKLRATTLVVVILAGLLTRGFWVSQIVRSLACVEELAPSDIILVENFDPSHFVFARAAQLQKAGFAPRVLVHVQHSSDAEVDNPVSERVADLMARHAQIAAWQVIPTLEAEPNSLNAAKQIRDYLVKEHVTSLIVVTRVLRSRRSSLVYHAVLDSLGTHVYCAPVSDGRAPERWPETWHGIQDVAEEFLKLQYYRFYILPFRRRA